MKILNEDLNQVAIFEDFEISILAGNSIIVNQTQGTSFAVSSTSINSNLFITSTDAIETTPIKKKGGFFYTVFKNSVVAKFFNKLKLTIKETNHDNIATQQQYIARLYKMAKDSGQTAYSETLEKEGERLTKEIQLCKLGIKTFLEEADVIKLATKRINGVLVNDIINIDWLKNFGRRIPDDAYDLISRLNESNVFDNYVIMHYDPNNNGYLKTKEEEIKEKDPVLLGVLRCSNRLYYLADWIDEFCNLTLQDILTTLNVDEKSRKLPSGINRMPVTNIINLEPGE